MNLDIKTKRLELTTELCQSIERHYGLTLRPLGAHISRAMLELESLRVPVQTPMYVCHLRLDLKPGVVDVRLQETDAEAAVVQAFARARRAILRRSRRSLDRSSTLFGFGSARAPAAD